MGRNDRLGFIGACLLLGSGPSFATTWHAMDWIDGDYQTTTSEWRQNLGIDWTRVSCRVTIRNTPQKCVNFLSTSPTAGIARYFLYLESNSPTLAGDASRYSALTLNKPAIESVGFDDFFSYYQPLYDRLGSAAPQALTQIIDNLKSVNRNLKFGATIYENELDPGYNPYIDALHLPASVKGKFDYVHLFLHYRKNGANFAAYVAQAQAAFPNAKIIAGVYSYDRIDYFPCAQNDRLKTPCTPQEELATFGQTLTIQMQLLGEGKIVGLEFFPGYFGAETDLYGPGPNSDQLTCLDVPRCIQTTLAMRKALLAAHDAALTVAAPTILLQPDDARLGPGQVHRFSLTAAGAGPLSYQWTKNDLPIKSATDPAYQTPPVAPTDTLSTFACKVANAGGVTASRSVLLTVSPASSQPIAQIAPPLQVYPNPWKSDKDANVPISFSPVQPGSTVKIFTVSGHLVRTLAALSNLVTWNRTTSSGQTAAAGLYIYLLTTEQGQAVHGTLAIAK